MRAVNRLRPNPRSSPREQQEKLNARNRFVSDADKAQREGNPAAARTAVEKALVIERDVFGDDHPDVAGSLARLTGLCVRLEDFPAAGEYARKALAVRKKLHGDSYWKTTDARLELADVEVYAKLTRTQRDALAEAEGLKDEFLLHDQRGE